MPVTLSFVVGETASVDRSKLSFSISPAASYARTVTGKSWSARLYNVDMRELIWFTMLLHLFVEGTKVALIKRSYLFAKGQLLCVFNVIIVLNNVLNNCGS